MAFLGQRVPVLDSEPAYCYGFRSKQRVKSRSMAVVLGMFYKMRSEAVGGYDDFAAKMQVLYEWDALLKQNCANWFRIYWSPTFAQEVEQASQDLRFEAIASEVPLLYFLDHQGPFTYSEISEEDMHANCALGVEANGDFVYALFGDEDEQVPLDCGHSVMAATVRNKLPKNFQHISLAQTHACEICYKETTLSRVVKVLNRREFVKIFLPCIHCSAKATFHFSCGCSVCDEHVLTFSVFEEDDFLCTIHTTDKRFTIPERQLLFALYYSLKPLSEFRPFPRQFQTHCKNNHERQVTADHVLHELCCLCSDCMGVLSMELEAAKASGEQPARVKCPLCCAWVYTVQYAKMGTEYFESTILQISAVIPAGACCLMCDTYKNIKVNLVRCNHYLCLNCIPFAQQSGGCLCGVQLHDDDFHTFKRAMQNAVHYTEKSPHCKCCIATDQLREQVGRQGECFKCGQPLTDIDVLHLKYQLILFDVRD